jgi:hypothetical protein
VSEPTSQQVLDTPMDGYLAETFPTIRDFLFGLLSKLWKDGEDFNGKRPFGNSSWDWDVFAALMKAGLISGTFDEDGYIDDCDEQHGDRLIKAAIAALASRTEQGLGEKP